MRKYAERGKTRHPAGVETGFLHAGGMRNVLFIKSFRVYLLTREALCVLYNIRTPASFQRGFCTRHHTRATLQVRPVTVLLMICRCIFSSVFTLCGKGMRNV